MKRLPALKKLESMHPQNAWDILDAEANKTRDSIAHDVLLHGNASKGERRRLKRIYAIADDLDLYVGQPGYFFRGPTRAVAVPCPAAPVEKDYCGIIGDMLPDFFKDTAGWRREKAAEHPDDARNLEAAELLERLALTVPTDHMLARKIVEADDSEDAGMFSEAFNGVLTRIGFDSAPKTADEFLRLVVDDCRFPQAA
jgi:hypothetical protein